MTSLTPDAPPPGGVTGRPPRTGIGEGVLTGSDADNRARWRPGERLHHLFEAQCDERGGHLAADAERERLTYAELDARANRLARHLIGLGVGGGDRVGLLFDDAVHAYTAMLAVLKVNAAYVPLDPGFPADRIGYITGDAGIGTVLTCTHLRAPAEQPAVRWVLLDEVRTSAAIAGQDRTRLGPAETPAPAGELCYVIYTSGSTGRPKGVAVDQAAICNFVRVAAQTYGIRPADRVYQGMTIAFDFSVEEIWVPWLSGATLVPKPGGAALVGHDLHAFLTERRVTALCCVPTLLATVEQDLPQLRFLLVSGEACPEDLITRWHRPDRRFLNVYGPTEATVTATWAVVDPAGPVTIGVPLPTYSVVVLDPDAPRLAAPGQAGELGIAGIGLARGYLNRDELTERAFIPDFLGLPDNPSGRIYRTGDLARITPAGLIEYRGRIDTQVKIRGYRIELTEVESALLGLPGIAAAVVSTHAPVPGTVELAAYYSRRTDSGPLAHDRILAHLRDRLPGYMIPAYLQELDTIPLTPGNKADRRNLPAPRGPRSTGSDRAHVAPATSTERELAGLLAGVLGADRVSVRDHVFADLGANSLLIARFCARVRAHPDLPPVSMKDVYLQPHLAALAAALDTRAPAGPAAPVATPPPPRPVSGPGYLLCGVLQLLVFLVYCAMDAFVLDNGITWVGEGDGLLALYLRSAGFAAAGFTVLCTVSIAAKWLLVGRWKPTEIRLWSLGYARFWAVRTLQRLNPLTLFVGTPLYVGYLRLMGARIGPGVTILSANLPVCTDLLTVGAGTIIRKDTLFTGYRAESGRLRTGRVTLGAGVFVGEASVLDINTTLGDRAQLGHSSSLHEGQSVPDGAHWHGSPAVTSTVDYDTLEPRPCGPARRVRFSVLRLLLLVLVYVPLLLGALTAADRLFTSTALTGAADAAAEVGETSGLYLGLLLAGLLLITTLPRALSRLVRPGRVYPLFGFHHGVQRTITRLSNLRTFQNLFGDSSAIVHYLRGIGYDLGDFVQTGSNFGLSVRHDSPLLSGVGRGTMVSDGLSIGNLDYSSTSFRLAPTMIGEQNFAGNNIHYPTGGRTGSNCLLATKVMIPLDGPLREDTGLLGSPCFEIPRSVDRDSRFAGLATGEALRRGLARKNRHNAVTMLVYLLAQCLGLGGTVLIALVAGGLHPRFGPLVWALDLPASLVFLVGYWILVERAVAGFRRLRPRFCSIYDPVFWRHERFWKLSSGRYLTLFNGTPFKILLWRLLGVRMGRRVFDDGCGIPEKSLVRVGDDCVLNLSAVLQGHSLEDGAFKSDRISLGAGCVVGTNAFVHYGVTMADGAVLGPDSFLMKGTEVTTAARWGGNPAVELGATTSVPAPTARGELAP
ncbi:Pls/PosA family non-ribosomal peptide synthetase [Amycolatopsis sp. PS_44_ISF1]|uniref:Pls/PosA family non-ribosomal peptide synthetase n=1 Tax=Amycolatopsis sp. PS_44_ISF1 TaxID=2974917 RepID=UPI0028DDADB0|nr:Pls/PosA family non-ribosomal peptide synthetase [Amycolatopsis sp. PS_44_ISF1]MDT8913870.1 amino acid adenylation domain-containing protein [Amycolatopsis sp. PS_44_ISF1]